MTESNDLSESYYLTLEVDLHQESADLWTTFCFEKEACGIEVISETETRQQQRIFFEKKTCDTVLQYPRQFARSYPNTRGIVSVLKLESHPYEDWQSVWKDHFRPLEAGRSFTVCPPWDTEVGMAGRTLLVINPNQGFGTGHHPSTLLALEALEARILDDPIIPRSLLDVGTGSGILSFAAAHLGVPLVHGVDHDFAAIRDVVTNRKLNNLEHVVQAVVGRADCLNRQYAVVISNMLSQELLETRSDLVHKTEPQGTLICSGFLESQWPELNKAFQALGMKPQCFFEKEEWQAAMLIREP